MNNSLSARLVVMGLRTDHRSRRETDTMRLHIAVNSNKQDDNGEGMQIQTSSLITVALRQNVHFNGEALINSSESQTQTQLNNPPLMFIIFPLVHGSVTKTVMTMGEVGHGVTVFIGSLLTQPERRLYIQNIRVILH